MTKRALCVGINDYPIRGMDLKGCVNDAKAWATLLTNHYDFAKGDVAMLRDKEATKANIVKGLKALLAGATRGDVLVFTNSSHGTYVADRNGDERLYDEAICPWDNEVLVDDELRELFTGLPQGVRLTVISDSCHSGSLTRALPPGRRTPDDRRVRFMNPRAIGLPAIKDVRRNAKPRRTAQGSQAAMNEILLSGCRDDQFAFDAKFGRKYHGAMSFTALGIIAGANYRITYGALHRKLVPALREAMFDQEPQLEGRPAHRRRQLFT